jgi:hypothetical protein
VSSTPGRCEDGSHCNAAAKPRNKGELRIICFGRASLGLDARDRRDTTHSHCVESIDAVFQAVLTAATQDGDMAAVKLLIDRESLIECAEPGGRLREPNASVRSSSQRFRDTARERRGREQVQAEPL